MIKIWIIWFVDFMLLLLRFLYWLIMYLGLGVEKYGRDWMIVGIDLTEIEIRCFYHVSGLTKLRFEVLVQTSKSIDVRGQYASDKKLIKKKTQ